MVCDHCGERVAFAEPESESEPDARDKLLVLIARRLAKIDARLADLEAGRTPDPDVELVGPAEMARRMGRSREWVYDHATELGGRRLKTGPKAAIYFNPAITREILAGRAAGNGNGGPPRSPAPERRRPPATSSDAPLLPVRGEAP